MRFSSTTISTLIVILLTLSGCGSSSSKQSVDPKDSEQTKELNIILDTQDSNSSVNISPLNTECVKSCSKQINSSTAVTLKALPAPGYEFLGWHGDCEVVDSNECQLTLDQDKTVSTEFKALDKTILGISIQGNGNIRTSLGTLCEQNCLITVTPNSQLTLTAEPGLDSTLESWGNTICDDELLTCTIEVAQSIQISPIFATQSVQQVNVNLAITGQGSVEVLNTNQICEDKCNIALSLGDSLTLKAQADNGHILENWSNDCSTSSICSFTVNANSVLTATFSPSSFDKSINSLRIKEPLGIDRTNHPIQFARPFIKGEIQNFPEVVIDGKSFTQQVNVKQRYDDGSVKHAVFNIVLDDLPAGSEVFATFINKSTSNNTPLTQAEMLSDTFNFNANMQFTFDEIANVSARDMLSSEHYEYWLQGPIATSVVLQDHSTEGLYDVGADSHKSIRPIIIVTFWPTINEYTVRFIAENANTQTLQDQHYDIDLSVAGTSRYQKLEVPHQAMSRWTQKYGSNPAMTQPLSIDHNIEHLVKTNAVPNFDTSRQIPESQIAQDWDYWQRQSSDIYDKGLWQTAMSTGGGRPDIGLYPSWAVKWLYTGDWRHLEIATTQAELSASWPIHLREGQNSRKFDFAEQINALGKVISLAPSARPTHWTDRPDWHEINANDKITFISPQTNSIWNPDNAHHPDLSSLQFLLLGDYFYLEQMIFSAAFVTGNNNAKGFNSRLGRGQTGSEGTLYSGEVRGQAWAFRTRLNTVDILPDNFAEKPYFDHLNINAIAAWEGLFNTPLSYSDRQTIYEFSKLTIASNAFKVNGLPSSIGQWSEGTNSTSYVRADRVNTANVTQAMAPWMQNFVVITLGRAKELGYKTEQLLSYSGQQLLAPFADPSIAHHMINAYITPTLDQNGQWFTSWHDIFAQYTEDYKLEIENFTVNNQDAEHGYYSIAMAAASYLHEEPSFDLLWQYMQTHVMVKDIYNSNPKWALLPRLE